MNRLINLLLADAPLSDPSALHHPLTESAKNEPLIDTAGQNIVFVGVVLLAIMIVVIVRIISPRVEHAVIAAIALSLGLVGLFFVVGH